MRCTGVCLHPPAGSMWKGAGTDKGAVSTLGGALRALRQRTQGAQVRGAAGAARQAGGGAVGGGRAVGAGVGAGRHSGGTTPGPKGPVVRGGCLLWT